MESRRWIHMTERDVNKHKREVCINCAYLVTMYGPTGHVGTTICDYIGKTGMIRPCSPLECVDKGIFKPRKRMLKVKGLEECDTTT